MTSEEQFKKVSAQVSEAVARGAKALTGGRANPNFSGLYYEPTVLVDVNHDMTVIQEETFGPVLPIIKVRDAEEALRLANDSRYGLDACIFTRDKEKALQIGRQAFRRDSLHQRWSGELHNSRHAHGWRQRQWLQSPTRRGRHSQVLLSEIHRHRPFWTEE